MHLRGRRCGALEAAASEVWGWCPCSQPKQSEQHSRKRGGKKRRVVVCIPFRKKRISERQKSSLRLPEELAPVLEPDAPREDVDRVAREATLELDAVEELVLGRHALEEAEVDERRYLSMRM